uniref:Uncharacterized protein n=1 Tax=Grammatophora oceanica TaxID=210454 RepID=A0A7S1Y7W9_9STRA|mmetsp:Transcript_34605/g.51376  ORF Transcript_34605/g.51376 Transcript_34605/m.51376 type:complete len:120 (+) Transcript_34605:209-568(+)
MDVFSTEENLAIAEKFGRVEGLCAHTMLSVQNVLTPPISLEAPTPFRIIQPSVGYLTKGKTVCGLRVQVQWRESLEQRPQRRRRESTPGVAQRGEQGCDPDYWARSSGVVVPTTNPPIR